MRRRTLMTLPMALALTGCLRQQPAAMAPAEFERRVRAMAGVSGVDTTAVPWTVTVDAGQPEATLTRLSTDLFELVNSTSQAPDAAVVAISGLVRAPVMRRGKGRPPEPPDLRWVRWLAGVHQVVSARVDERFGSVTLAPGVAPMTWATAFVAAHRVPDPQARLNVVSSQARASLTPGAPTARGNSTP